MLLLLLQLKLYNSIHSVQANDANMFTADANIVTDDDPVADAEADTAVTDTSSDNSILLLLIMLL